MFNRNTETGTAPSAPPQQPLKFPELRTYKVQVLNREWEKVKGHHASVDALGTLTIARGIFMNEDCTQVGAEPAMMYATGEWKRCTTDYEGFQRESPLSL